MQFTQIFFSSLNHMVLIGITFLLVASEIGYPGNWFRRNLPLIGPDAGLVTLGLVEVYPLTKLIKIAFASYMFSDRHCVVTKKSPAFLDKLLLATGIISGLSALFNIAVVYPTISILTAEHLFHILSQGGNSRDYSYDTPIRDTCPSGR
jgi:hypothetical protein